MKYTRRSALGDGQGPEQNRVHHREDRRVDADSQGQGGDRSQGERGALDEYAKGVLQVAQQGFDHLRGTS
jgi:hypothetical protein